MAPPVQRPRPKPGRQALPGTMTKAVLAVIAVAIVAYVVYGFALGLSVPTVTSATAFNVTNSTTLFYLGGGEYAIHLVTVTPGIGAILELSQLPALVNPDYLVTVTLNNETKVNAGTTSANLEISAKALTGKSALVSIAPIDPTLGIAPDSDRIQVVQTVLIPLNQSVSPVASTSSSTTTASSTGSTTGSTTIAATTTAGGSYPAQVLTELQPSIYYIALANMSKMFNNSAGCTPTLYNTTYQNKYAKAPSGYNSYRNISAITPTSMTLSITSVTSSLYKSEWVATAKSSLTNGVAASVNVSISGTGGISGFTTLGFFAGQNISVIGQEYNVAKGFNNACGILMVSAGP